MKYKNYTLGFIEIRNIFDECHENKKAIKTVENGIYNNAELLHLAITELDSKPLSFIKQDIIFFEKELAKLDAVRLFSGDFDKNNAYVEIKAGSGGVESQDWANMLVRMYSRWAVTHDFQTETVNLNIGELLGVKSATLHIKGDYAFGWMRTEKGIHRLVRKSPFDSSKRRHTSFTSVFVYPELTRKVHNIKINTNELRIDTYRSSGAGGQHVNTTDSAVRITHLPTKIVVECQSERSQHSNKERALTLLKTKLYDFDKKKGEVERINIEKKKAGICWGNQIRSYVLDAQRIKDLRTGVKNNNCEKVLNGELDLFIEASIKQGL